MASLNNTDEAQIIQDIGSCVSDLRGALTDALEMDAAVVFASVIKDEEIYVQPIVVPVDLANKMAAELFKMDRMSRDEFCKQLTGLLQMMRVNSTDPAPTKYHIMFLGMFERILHTGMEEHEDIVMGLTRLSSGDLVAMQVVFDRSDYSITTGMRVVKKPLEMVTEQPERDFIFPENMTQH